MFRFTLLALILLAPLATADPVEPRFIDGSSESSCATEGTMTTCDEHTVMGGVALASEGEDLVVVTAETDTQDRYDRPASHYDWTTDSDSVTYLRIITPEGERRIDLQRCEERFRGALHDYDESTACTLAADTEGMPDHGVDTYWEHHATPDNWATVHEGQRVRVGDASVASECDDRHRDTLPFERHEECVAIVANGETSITRQYSECDGINHYEPGRPASEYDCRTGAFLDEGGFVGLEEQHDTHSDGSTTTTNALLVDAAGVEQRVPLPAAAVDVG